MKKVKKMNKKEVKSCSNCYFFYCCCFFQKIRKNLQSIEQEILVAWNNPVSIGGSSPLDNFSRETWKSIEKEQADVMQETYKRLARYCDMYKKKGEKKKE